MSDSKCEVCRGHTARGQGRATRGQLARAGVGSGVPCPGCWCACEGRGPADEHRGHRELVIDLLRGTSHTHESHSPEALRKRRKVSKGFAGP